MLALFFLSFERLIFAIAFCNVGGLLFTIFEFHMSENSIHNSHYPSGWPASSGKEKEKQNT
jgi:hypothetical protein